MLVSVNLWNGTLPANNTGYLYTLPPTMASQRTDLLVTWSSCYFDSVKNQYQIFVTIGPIDPTLANKTTVQTDGGQTPITSGTKGFSLRTGWPGYTATSAIFQMIFDSADNLPDNVQVQLGAKGGGKTPNSGYTFAKSKIVMEDDK